MATHIVDTNIIVRLVTNDVPYLADQAAAQLEHLADDSVELPLYVLAESVYVLAFNTNYLYSHELVATALQHIIGIEQFSLSREVAISALDFFRTTNLDFVDCLLLGLAKNTGQTLLTFDKALLRKLKQG
jgi:predicted nucleic-acid-binding protein